MKALKTISKSLIKSTLGPEFLNDLLNRRQLKLSMVGLKSFSQEGEDRLLANLFHSKCNGFYVDIGAHHPFSLSNTNLFYEKGWRGINVDANPDCIRLFQGTRDRDINLALGVGKERSNLAFYKFMEPALSSFDSALSSAREAEGRKIREVIQVEVLPLSTILETHLPAGVKIDFMNVDVEGLDLEVLKSNDWNLYRPTFLVVECLGLEIEQLTENETYQYLKSVGYQLSSKLINSCIFVDQKD